MPCNHQATILHADLDAFYASVEQMLDPSLQGLPIAVGGGVVLAASYEAKAFGVFGGMSGRDAKALCPQLQFVSGNFDDYKRLGDAAIAVIGDFTPSVERISIDEAFANVAGCEHLFGPPADIARQIRQRVRDELGLAISIGVARTKHLAKIASQVAKPDGLSVVLPHNETSFLRDLPVDLMWGVGPVTRERLASRGITKIGQLAQQSPERLRHLLGRSVGNKLSDLANNNDPRRITTRRRTRSVSAQSALGRQSADQANLTPTVWDLADRVAGRLRAKDRGGRTVTLRVRFQDMRAITRSATAHADLGTTATLAGIAMALLSRALHDHRHETVVTLLAISVSQLDPSTPGQLELPLPDVSGRERARSRKQRALAGADRAIDNIRERFGRQAVGYGTAVLSGHGAVPNAFRELAQRD